MPRGTKVDTAERALKASARKKGLSGRRAGAYTFGTLNNIGLKRGNKTTARGAMKSKTASASASDAAAKGHAKKRAAGAKGGRKVATRRTRKST